MKDIKNYVAYMVGDQNIGLGGLVAFDSLQKHNPGIDCKMYTYTDKLDPVIKAKLISINVELINLNQFTAFMAEFSVETRAAMTWPPEVFLNYYIPNLLQGEYQYAFKIDYDVLFNDTIDLEEVTPNSAQVISSIHNAFTCTKMNRISIHIPAYQQIGKFDFPRMLKTGINTGFLTIDIDAYCELAVFESMREVYAKLKVAKEEAYLDVYVDQGLLNITIEYLNIKFKEIPLKYNLTTTACKYLKGADITMFHYTGVMKPWKKNELTEQIMNTQGYANIFMSYYWLNHVEQHLPEIKPLFETNFDQLMMRASLDLWQQILELKEAK